MNAPQPIHATYRNFPTIAQSLDALAPIPPFDKAGYDRAHAAGELGASLEMIDQAVSALVRGAWLLSRAVGKGAGACYDLTALEGITGRLADAALSVETSTSLLTARVHETDRPLAAEARAAGITLASDEVRS